MRCKSFRYNTLRWIKRFSPTFGTWSANSLEQSLSTPTPDCEKKPPMSHTRRASTLEQDQIPADLQRLANAIAAMPSEQAVALTPWIDAVVESTKRRRRILSLVQDALSQLRLDMKYLMFDLEATRRERDEYRMKLEEFEGEA
jgi:hypothetical protein